MIEPHERQLEALMDEHARRSFGPGFVDRVMDRVESHGSAFERMLVARFLPLAASVLLVALALGAYSLFGTEPYEDQSPLEAMLGLQPVTIEAAYSFTGTAFAEPTGETS